MTKQVPPHDRDAEQAVLGSMLQDPAAVAVGVERLRAGDFYFEAHQMIFTVIVELFSLNQPSDMVTVVTRLDRAGDLTSAGGPAYVATLTDSVPLAANIAHYSQIVKDKSQLRKTIIHCHEVINQCYGHEQEVDEIVGNAEAGLFELSGDKGEDVTTMLDIVKGSVKSIKARAEVGGGITGVSTGFIEFDRMTAGLQPTDLIIIAGRPSMGKTALAMNMVRHAAVRTDLPCLVFSLEMSKEQLGDRLLATQGRINGQRLRIGALAKDDWPKLAAAEEELGSAPIFVVDTPALSILDVRAKARRMHARHGVGLVMVDYLQLMRGRNKGDNRQQEIADISRGLKALAKELQVPVVALSQLNRELEKRPDKRPMLSDLRESGAIEQDADLICFIYRDEVYNKSFDNPLIGTAELIVGKQRNGPVGTVKLTFQKQFSVFNNAT